MPARSADGILRTEPIIYDGDSESIETGEDGDDQIETSLDTYVPPADDGHDWTAWNRWWESRQDEFERAIGKCVGTFSGELRAAIAVQAKRINELELKFAEAVGALNVLRGKEAPGSFNVRGTFDPDTVYNYLDVVAFNGSSWIATRDRPGEVPGPGWQLLSSAGKRGPRGEPGPPGAPGKEGRFPQARVWRDQVHYAGDVVVYEGSTYQALNDTGKPPTFAKDWTLLAVAGHDGKSLRPSGSFDADVEYRALDVVFCGGSSYLALCDAPGKCPSNNWQLLAAPGRDGKDGATGPRGERGECGLIGPRGGPAPRITGWRVDHAAYTAVPLLSDGSEGASLELRSLFKQFLDEVAPRA